MPYNTPVRVEQERKFIVQIDERFFARARKRIDIVQGYVPTAPDHELRSRIMDGRQAYLTRKEGVGYSRPEEEESVSVRAARLVLRSCDEPIEKDRIKTLHKGRLWEVDIFKGKLHGLTLAELEGAGRDELLEFPRYVTPVKEVTYSLSNRHLARFIHDREHGVRLQNLDELMPRKLPRCVLTGGPGSGKSTLMRILRRKFGRYLHCMPEVATVIIKTMGIKPPPQPEARRRFQRGVLRIQLDFENISELQIMSDGKDAMLLDRGALDVAPYFPRGLEEFDETVRLDRAWLHGLYDLVICLDVPPRAIYDRIKSNNRARYETYDQAAETGRKTVEAWQGHPRFCHIRNEGGWELKSQRVINIVSDFVTRARLVA